MVQFFQLFFTFEVFHHKMLAEKRFKKIKFPFESVSQTFLVKLFIARSRSAHRENQHEWEPSHLCISDPSVLAPVSLCPMRKGRKAIQGGA